MLLHRDADSLHVDLLRRHHEADALHSREVEEVVDERHEVADSRLDLLHVAQDLGQERPPAAGEEPSTRMSIALSGVRRSCATIE